MQGKIQELQISALAQAVDTASLAGKMKKLAQSRRAAGMRWGVDDLPIAGSMLEPPEANVGPRALRARALCARALCVRTRVRACGGWRCVVAVAAPPKAKVEARPNCTIHSSRRSRARARPGCWVCA